MSRVGGFYIVTFLLLSGGPCESQSVARGERTPQPLRFDLSKINTAGGEQECLSKGRLQDPEYNQSKVVDQIVAAGPKAIPVLIGMITDTRRTKEPVFCFWEYTAIGDIAFCMLTDLFTNASWTEATIPGIGWDAMLGHKEGAGLEQLHDYIREHGRAALQAKWERVWEKYKDRVYWDSKERCFKLKER